MNSKVFNLEDKVCIDKHIDSSIKYLKANYGLTQDEYIDTMYSNIEAIYDYTILHSNIDNSVSYINTLSNKHGLTMLYIAYTYIDNMVNMCKQETAKKPDVKLKFYPIKLDKNGIEQYYLNMFETQNE